MVGSDGTGALSHTHKRQIRRRVSWSKEAEQVEDAEAADGWQKRARGGWWKRAEAEEEERDGRGKGEMEEWRRGRGREK